MIKFDLEDYVPNVGTQFISGTYTKYSEDFEFTLCVMYDKTSDSNSYEVTWIEKKPRLYAWVEVDIIQEFELL